MGANFNWAALISTAIVLVLGGAAWYVRSTVDMRSAQSMSEAMGKLTSKIDSIKESISLLLITTGRTEERVAGLSRDMDRLESRVTKLEGK